LTLKKFWTEAGILRPRFLEIEGLQSFKNMQCIDFDVLSETGLFGIFGPTGSGKSTVLDAITLALYGNVQRAARGTQGIINSGLNTVRVAFTFDLLKDNSRKTFKAERLYRRKKGSENSAEARTARLSEIAGEIERVVADKPIEVTAKVEELLGLKLDDFTRSVVLPQNKFQEFLLLEKSRKREMLERIFYLEEYGRKLSEKVSKRMSSLKLRLSSIEGAMSSLGDASEKSLIEAESAMKSAVRSKEAIDLELKVLDEKYNEAREVWELVRELEQIEEKENEHLKSSDEINNKKNMYSSSLKAEGLTEYISKYKDAEMNLVTTVEMLAQIDGQLPQIEKQLAETRNAYLKCKEELDKEKPCLIEKKAKLNNALEISKEAESIGQKLDELRKKYILQKKAIELKELDINKGKSELEKIEDNIDACKRNVEKTKVDIDYRNEIYSGVKLEEAIEALENQKNKLKTEHDCLQKKVFEIEEKLADITARKLSAGKVLGQCSRDDVLHSIDNYHNIWAIFENLKAKKAETNEINKKLSTLNIQIGRQSAAVEEAEIERNLSAKRLEQCRQEVDKLNRFCEKNAASAIAKHLVEGQPCPVCGSIHHPNPAVGLMSEQNNETEEKLKNATRLLQETEKELRGREKNCIKLEENLKNLEHQLADVARDLEIKEKEYSDILQSLPHNLQNIDFQRIESELADMYAHNQKKLRALEEVSVLDTEESGKKVQLEGNKENLSAIKRSLDECIAELESRKNTYKEFIVKFNINDAKSELKKLEESERFCGKLQRQLELMQGESKEARSRLERLIEERHSLIQKFTDLDADGRNLKAQKTEKEQKVRELAGGGDIAAEIRLVEERLNSLVNTEMSLQESVKKLEDVFSDMSTRKAALSNQKEIYTKSLEYEARLLNTQLVEKGFENIEQAIKAILSKEEKNSLEAQIAEYERTQRNLQAQREMVQKKLDRRSITPEEWNNISGSYSLAKQKRDEIISLFESAKNSYTIIKNNFEKWVELEKDFMTHSRKYEMLEQIQKLLKGNSFVEFISEERLRYIAKEATETLGILTKHRYALEIDSENGFIIRDNANGGVHRLVSSLSGGETFLASLSLALALSKQIQLKGQSPLEFFFLDEGFGTLDGSLLDTVMDALERISSNQRVIGLISHVPELRNRMSRRLIVEPPRIDGKGSRVSVERA
jgi:exonuclease SbcC